MGMFDYIKCEYPLPELPQAVIDRWEGSKNVAFQTKDTPDQSMTLYNIDADGQLWQQHKISKWVEPVNPEGESVMDRIGHLETLTTWWEKESFTGTIDFYESYHHDDYSKGEPLGSNQWKRFVDGWIEYTAVFLRGQLIDSIEVSRNESAKKLTDEELDAKIKEWDAKRKEWDDQFRQRRKDHPSPEQKLIDNIDRECKLSRTIMDEQDLSYALNNIGILIKEYRKKIDKWYEEA